LNLDITQYKSIVFDVHGVVLDSNVTKIDSYFRTAKKLGGTDEQAQALVDYHIEHSGVISSLKFKWYIAEVLKEVVTDQRLHEFMDAFSLAITKGLLTCRIATGLDQLRKKTMNADWLLVSEGGQAETQELFEKRALADLFNGGIFGSPQDKEAILSQQKSNGNIKMPALFIGDCQYDYEVAVQADLDFVFISDWTDMPYWKDFCENNNIQVCRNIKSL